MAGKLNWRRGVTQLWSPHAAPDGGILFWRIRLLQAPAFLVAGALGIVAFLAAIVLHQPGLARPGFIAMAIAFSSKAVYLAFRLRYVFWIGRWTGWRREPIRRLEEPLHFWIRTGAEVLACLAYVAAAAFLYSFGVGLMP